MTTIVSSGFLDAVWDVISSRVAIGIYVILMLIAVIVLIVSVILDEQRRVDPLRLLRDGISNQVIGVRQGKVFNMPIADALKVEKHFRRDLYDLVNNL